jgi:molecular chaperone DnaK (HSP70)
MQDIVIVLEPEAASLCVKNLQGAQVESGDVVLVLDCGGGTVDLVTHDVQEDGTVKELAAGSGDCCGGSYVDTGFGRLMNEKFGSVFTDWATRKPRDVLKLRKQWLTAKITFGSGGITKRALVTLPQSLQKKLAKAQLIDDDDDDDLELSEREMKSIFDPIVDRILELTEEQYKASARAPTKLLLVGGFAGSPYLQLRVKAAFEGRVKAVVVPPTPGAAVVKGAVIYGLNPKVVAARIARRTYGVGTRVIFNDAVHKAAHKVMDEEVHAYYAQNVFSVFANAGTEVSYDAVVTKVYTPTKSEQSTVGFRLFSCSHAHPVHTDEPTARREGYISIACPGTGLDRSVSVEMKFGRSQILVTAINEVGERVEAKVEFAQVQPGGAGGLVAMMQAMAV